MKVFLTGATGFLGKKVLASLISDPRIERIDIASRRKVTHPDPRVFTHQIDLADPWNTQEFLEETDAVIHLAGLYNFSEPFSRNYQQNVLPVLNLIDRVREIKSSSRPPILFASSYDVGFGSEQILHEGPLTTLPPTYQSYAYTKAIAERALTDSGLAARIFRLGILVGDSQTGEFEKIDGPYYLMRVLNKIKKLPFSGLLRSIPLPYSPSGLLPLVPVDSAAEVIHEALFLESLSAGKQEYYGVFNTESLPVEVLGRSIFKEFLPRAEPKPLQREFPVWLQKGQTKISGIPKEFFNFSYAPVKLANSHFCKTFGAERIPHFNEYRTQFFKGFHQCFTLN